jgi:hypothetical protein
MAGTLVITTLSDGTNSTSATNCIQGSAKAWVKFNGTASTIQGSFNVSSVTRISQGRYTINFTNAMANTNYAVTGIGSHVVGVVALFSTLREGSRSTSAYEIDYFDIGSNLGDTTDANTAVFA